MVTILKQKKMQVQLMRMRYQNQRNTEIFSFTMFRGRMQRPS